MRQKLPHGWLATKLGEITEPSRERALPVNIPDANYVGLEHIEPETMRLLSKGRASDVRSSSVRFSEGDVLYGKMRPYLNKVWVAEFEGICSSEFIVFPKSEELNSQFLAMRLNAGDFVDFANGQTSGERPRVSFEKISHFPILLPPINEQKRIVQKLEVTFSSVQRAEKATLTAKKRLEDYRAAILRTAATGELTRDWRKTQKLKGGIGSETGAELLQQLLSNRQKEWERRELARFRVIGKAIKNDNWKARYAVPAGPSNHGLYDLPERWAWTTVEQLAANEERSITDGPFGSNLKTSHYTSSGPRVIRLQNIGDGIFIDEKSHISPKHYELLSDHAVFAGDIVIRALGTPAPRACRIPQSLGPALVKADCVRLKVVPRLVDPDFVMWMLNSPPVQDVTARMVHGIGRPRLNLREIKSIALPLPPLDEQKQIVSEIDSQLSASSKLDSALNQQLARARATRQALLQDAFQGQLATQDPEDIPAWTLLEKIHAIREIKAKTPKVMSKSKTKSKRRGLLDLLSSEPMTPEQLFHAAGFHVSEVDLFYRELASLRDQLVEEKPAGSDARLWPNRADVLLSLKEEPRK